jgi:catechol 2,3-dioxygenase-like lactoylglutathione lyase family enzyme
MAVTIDHLALPARDPETSAHFLGALLGVEVGRDGQDDEFFCLRLDAGVQILFTREERVHPHHFALRVDAPGLAQLVARLDARGIPYGNDPETPTNRRTDDPLGGKGRVYFVDPDGHLLEVCAPR